MPVQREKSGRGCVAARLDGRGRLLGNEKQESSVQTTSRACMMQAPLEGFIMPRSEAFLVLVLFLLAPDRPPPKEPPEPDPPVPNLAGLSNWGQIEQLGKKVIVFGHSHWTAEGEFD